MVKQQLAQYINNDKNNTEYIITSKTQHTIHVPGTIKDLQTLHYNKKLNEKIFYYNQLGLKPIQIREKLFNLQKQQLSTKNKYYKQQKIMILNHRYIIPTIKDIQNCISNGKIDIICYDQNSQQDNSQIFIALDKDDIQEYQDDLLYQL